MSPHAMTAEARDDFEGAVAKLGDVPLAVAVCDLDDFAAVNEELGREAGDAVLRSWERTLRGSLPREAVVTRIGGDEYAVALPDHSAESAVILLDEIQNHFAAGPSDLPRPVGVSAGIAGRPAHGSAPAELVTNATEALMRAKREGRSRIAVFVEQKMTLKSNYYTRAQLDRLSKLSGATGRTEASLLREALDDLLEKHRNEL